MTQLVDAKTLRSVVSYDPSTGVFTWLPRDENKWWNANYAGKRAGSLDRKGYLRILYNYRPYLAHRLAFLYMTGSFPKDAVDHRDGDRANNRWSNLRPATETENHRNRKRSIRNSTGFKGVSWCNTKKRFRAAIKDDDKARHLGYFRAAEEAAEAYRKAAVAAFGEFARFE